MDRGAVTRVIRDYAAAIVQTAEPPVEAARDPHLKRSALDTVCRDHGITVEEFYAALREDPSLGELARQATIASAVESPDPGPYDAISRESPSGQPGDLEKSRTLPRREAPGGS